MNLRMIRFLLGRILMVQGALFLVPLLVSLLYSEPLRILGSWFFCLLLCLGIGAGLSLRQPNRKRMFAREGFVLCALTWIVLSFFGCLPLVLSGEIPSLVDAFFEISSGFTTTGASVLNQIEQFSHSLLFWRSFTHLIGGMGILVFVLALLPTTDSDSSSVYILKAEVPGPTFGKMVSRVKTLSRMLYLIYLSMTVVLIIALLIAGMPLFDSCIHAFGAAGTGGFSSKSASVGFYQSPAVEWILGVAMLLFGVNFNLYYLLLIRQFRSALHDEEIRWYLGIVLGAVGLLTLTLWSQYQAHGVLIRDVFFTVSSIVTTTGYSTVDFGNWPLFGHLVLLLLMCIGSCAGSTAGGLKVSRVALLIKTIYTELRKSLSPNRVLPIRFNGKAIPSSIPQAVLVYFAAYCAIFCLSLVLISFSAPDFLSAFSAVAATLNNIGPGLQAVGPTQNFGFFSPFAKFILSLTMIFGRLEIIPMILLFTPRTWKRG